MVVEDSYSGVIVVVVVVVVDDDDDGYNHHFGRLIGRGVRTHEEYACVYE